MAKIYSTEEAEKIDTRIKKIELIRKNKVAHARRNADDIKHSIEIDQLLNHSDKLYYESLLD